MKVKYYKRNFGGGFEPRAISTISLDDRNSKRSRRKGSCRPGARTKTRRKEGEEEGRAVTQEVPTRKRASRALYMWAKENCRSGISWVGLRKEVPAKPLHSIRR